MRPFGRLIVVAVLLIAFTRVESKMTMDQIKNTLKPFKNSCLKKVTVEPAMVEATKQGEFPEEKPLQCFMRCVLQMMKVFKNGELLVPAIMSQIDLMMPDEYVDRMKEIVTNCVELANKEEDPCDRAFRFVKCFYMMDSELYFFP